MVTVNWNRMDGEVKSDKMALIFSTDQFMDTATVVELTARDMRHLVALLIRSRVAMMQVALREKFTPFSSK